MKKSDVRTFLLYIRKVFNLLLDFICPQFCLSCKREGSLCCAFCLNDIILDDLIAITWPTKDKKYFNSCYTCCDYQNELVQKLIKNYKYNYLENLANLLTDILERQARRLALNKNTIIVNIPLHRNKKRKRGFDQTEILAKKLAKRLNLEYYPLLLRTKDNKAQAKLNKSDREQNVKNIFSVNPSASPLRPRAQGREFRVSDKKVLSKIQDNTNILLIDDVTTTGSTLNQAAKVLKEKNFKNITCLVLAKNKYY